VRLCGDHVATAAFAEAKSVIGTGDPFTIVFAHAERRAAVRTEIVGDDDLIADAVDNEQFVEELCRYGAVDNFA
jgi:hypothetical protein